MAGRGEQDTRTKRSSSDGNESLQKKNQKEDAKARMKTQNNVTTTSPSKNVNPKNNGNGESIDRHINPNLGNRNNSSLNDTSSSSTHSNGNSSQNNGAVEPSSTIGATTSGTYNSNKSNSHGGANVGGSGNSNRQVNSHRGKTLGEKWILGDEIGRGAYASVYKGLDLKKGGFVAIKQFSLSGVGEDELAGIMQEIDLLKELRHKNIVEYFGSLRSRSHLYIIMEYVENGSLANIVRPSKFGPFPESLVAVYIAQVLEGLVFLHDQGVIHRDIKGANILTTKEGIVKLADFGVAVRFGECSVMTNNNSSQNSNSNNNGTPNTQSVKSSAGAVVGTPYWMAPEVIEMSGVTEKSDIWSVGCTAIELLTSSPPYFDLQPMSAMFRIVQDEFVPLPADVSETMLDFLQQCFNKEPKQRPDARILLTHPWIVTSKKQLQKSWRQQREKLGSKHEDIASVVERMVEHDITSTKKISSLRLSATPKVFGSDDQDEFPGTETPGKCMNGMYGSPGVRNGDILDGEVETQINKSFMSRAGQGTVPSAEAVAVILADVNSRSMSEVASSSTGPRQKEMELQRNLPSGNNVDGSDGKIRLEINELQSLISSLDMKRSSHDCANSLKRLEEIMKLKPERKTYFVDHGINQLMTCLENADINISIVGLRIIQILVLHNMEMLEKFCLLGLVPVVIRLSSIDKAPAVRAEAASLVFQMCLGSLFTAQTFVACQGIGALVAFVPLPGESRNRIRSDGAKQDAKSICERSSQIFMAVDSIWHLIELKITGKRGEICSICARSRLVERLVSLLWSWAQAYDEIEKDNEKKMHKPENADSKRAWWSKKAAKKEMKYEVKSSPPATISKEDKYVITIWKYCEKVITLMLVLSRATSDVKGHFCGDATAHRLVESIELVNKRPLILSRLLQCIRSLTSEPTALEPLQRGGAIQALVPIMNISENTEEKTSARIEALHSIFNLCHINRTRQEQAALAGVISPLQDFAKVDVSEDEEASDEDRQQALLLLFALAHASRRTRTELWRHDILALYLTYLEDNRWQVLAFDSIVVWLVHEASIVEGRLLQRGALKQIVGILTSADGEDLLRVLELYLTMLSKSKKICVSLASYGFSQLLINILEDSEDPHIKLTLLKVLRMLYEHHPRPRELSGHSRLKSQLKIIIEADEEMVLMKQISQGLLKAFNIGSALV